MIFPLENNPDYGALAAAASGMYAASGNFSKGAGNTLNIPEASLNIGGNGNGFRLAAQTNLDPLAAGNNDGSFAAWALGQDYYVYACQQAGTRLAKPLASIRSTFPDGFNAANSRKAAGFHYGRIRTMAQRFNAGAVLDTGIQWNSVWDLYNRPAGSIIPGMVKVGNFWVMIYLGSEDGTAWPNTIPLSRFNATPLTGTEGYSYFDYTQLASNIGWRLPTYNEFLMYAYGVPEGSVGGSARALTGSSTTLVSCYNVDQPSGNLYQVAEQYFAGMGTFAWVGYDQGKDCASGHGRIYHTNDFRQLLVGCGWGGGLNGGSRTAGLDNAPWSVYNNVGVRFVSNSLKICNP